MEIAPHARLYKHALESIFAHLCLADLVSVSATCRDWAAAVISMRPVGERAYVGAAANLHSIRHSRLAMRHVNELYCIGGPIDMYTLERTNPIGDVSDLCGIIKQSKSLTSVDVSSNSIKEVGAVVIAEAIKQGKSPLTTLNLRDNDIGDVGVAAIAEQAKSLTWLDVSSNAIGLKGAFAIAEAIMFLTTLDLFNMSICDVGTIEIARAIKKSTSLG